jgi:hypothetical protein
MMMRTVIRLGLGGALAATAAVPWSAAATKHFRLFNANPTYSIQ